MPVKKTNAEQAAARPPRPTRLIRAEIKKFMAKPDPNGETGTIGQARAGIYAFYDFDGEPIYVGQTSTGVSGRVGRHLTGQRSDAVGKFVLDPFEVADIEVWTLPEIAALQAKANVKKACLDPYESTVYFKLKEEARFKAVLNEKVPEVVTPIPLPTSVRGRIIPEELWEDRAHSDVRIARRAGTVARLAQLISEREIKAGLRRTLHLQTQRLNWLAETRLADLGELVATPGNPDDVTKIDGSEEEQ